MHIDGEGFTIRPVDEQDMDAILAVYRQCEDFLSLGPVPHASARMVLDDFSISRDEGGTFCGIFAQNEMIGVVDFVPGGFEGIPEDAYLSLLMLAQCHRRKGLGKKIVEAVEAQILKNAAIRRIRAGVQVNNAPAVAFWQSLGYRIVSGPETMPDTTVVYGLLKQV